jgi:hypothetical protein
MARFTKMKNKKELDKKYNWDDNLRIKEINLIFHRRFFKKNGYKKYIMRCVDLGCAALLDQRGRPLDKRLSYF